MSSYKKKILTKIKAQNNEVSSYLALLENTFQLDLSDYQKELIEKSKKFYEKLEMRASSEDDEKILRKLFRVVNVKNNLYYFINEINHFTIEEISILRKLGLDIKISSKVRSMEQGISYPVIISDHDFKSLMKNSDDIFKIVNDIFKIANKESFKTQFEPIKNEMVQYIRERISEGIKDFNVPNKSDLKSPKEISGVLSIIQNNTDSVNISTIFSRENGESMDFDFFDEDTRKTIQLQEQGLLPSILNPRTYSKIKSYKQIVLILIDVSGSTYKDDIYKFIAFAVEQVRRFIKTININTEVVIAPYDDNIRGYYKIVDSFEMPDGGTDYKNAFNESFDFFKKNVGYDNRIVINISDGAPNELPPAIEVACLFPVKKIYYSQIIFGHGLDNISESIIAEELQDIGADPEFVSDMKEYEESFTNIAKAAKGSQILVWVTKKLAEAVLGAMDLCIGNFFVGK